MSAEHAERDRGRAPVCVITLRSRRHTCVCTCARVRTENHEEPNAFVTVSARRRQGRVRGALSRHRVSRQTAWQLLDLFIRLAYLATYERACVRPVRARINTLGTPRQLSPVFMDVRATFRFGQLMWIQIYAHLGHTARSLRPRDYRRILVRRFHSFVRSFVHSSVRTVYRRALWSFTRPGIYVCALHTYVHTYTFIYNVQYASWRAAKVVGLGSTGTDTGF